MRHAETTGRAKLTTRLDVPCTEELRDEFVFLARAHGFGSVAEYVRQVLEVHAFGDAHRVRSLVTGRALRPETSSDEYPT